MSNFEKDFESEQWISLVNPFIQINLGETFGAMVPNQSLVLNGYCIANASDTKMLYYFISVNDRWDKGDNKTLTLKLSNIAGNYLAKWFSPRTGDATSAGILSGGKDHLMSPPSNDDWVLLRITQ